MPSTMPSEISRRRSQVSTPVPSGTVGTEGPGGPGTCQMRSMACCSSDSTEVAPTRITTSPLIVPSRLCEPWFMRVSASPMMPALSSPSSVPSWPISSALIRASSNSRPVIETTTSSSGASENRV